MINVEISITSGDANDQQIDVMKNSIRSFILQKMDDYLFELGNRINVDPKGIEIVDVQVT